MKKSGDDYKKNRHLKYGDHRENLINMALNHVFGGNVLDIGAGEGKGSIFLSRKGFNVTAIDKTLIKVKKIKKIAKEESLPIKTANVDVLNFDFLKNSYSLILSIAALDFLQFPDFKEIIKKAEKSLVPKGIFCFSGFSTRDLFLKKYKRMGYEMVGENTFYIPSLKTCQHFFTIKEVKEVFKNFKIILLKESAFKDSGHGNLGPHSHNTINLIARKN